MLEVVRIWNGIGSETNLNSRVICANVEKYMLVKN
jgi:hypothetical protein